MRERQKAFVEEVKEYEKMREEEENEKEKETVGNCWRKKKDEEVRTYLMAKLYIV